MCLYSAALCCPWEMPCFKVKTNQFLVLGGGGGSAFIYSDMAK